MRTGSQAPLLIAVAGLSPRAGTTTTTVALAHTWPGPEAALIVEADPLGEQLAEIVGADPYLGLASLARMTHPGEPITPDILARQVQRLPGGEALLAAPPHHDPTRAVPAVELLTDPHGSWRAFGATVFADCGVPEPDSPAHPVIAAADACLFVVRAEHIDPEPAAQRILDLTRRRRPRGIVLIGASRAYAAAIGFPVLGTLPASRATAQALLKGRRARRHLVSPARLIISDVEVQLRAKSRDRLAPPHAARQNRPSRRDDGGLRIYSIDGGPMPASRPRPPEPVLVEPAEPSTPPPASEPVLVEAAEDAGHTGEDDLAAAESSLKLETEIANSTPLPIPTEVEPALRLRVFGPTRIFWREPETGESVEITSQVQPRIRELLTVLALHPEGLSREQLIELLWSQRPRERGGSALANTVSRLRAAITTVTGGQITSVLAEDRAQFRLSGVLLGVDYWDFTSAVAARRRASSDTEQADAARTIAALATSELASDLTDTWVEALRESARRTSLNALSWLATRNTENDPRATLGILETTIENDPYNEQVWQDILRLHARLGEKAELTRTYTLLTHTLADIGQTPSLETRQLLERLRHATNR
ncbi:BTAD domain-containing putative transcriptional regulator [Nocardia fluminea]|uniref:DNA-binding SARP family transcriptional activator n=1 Tax=Nocardia fluminea TaxID=134984 RepID=A0A2N3WYH5_9NOCA|nr:BTAD domain-containing putative transcriptional regulator [Nocardia fluminea]PKV98933.1 DNA-binding SARP family transcriptional activator [Nocardia fluminea]